MKKQPLTTTILNAPRSLKTARYIADTLAMQIDREYQKSKPGREDKTIARFKDTVDGFTLYIPMIDETGAWKNCPVYRWTKDDSGRVKLEYDPRVVEIS
jgi:hypothetical protein